MSFSAKLQHLINIRALSRHPSPFPLFFLKVAMSTTEPQGLLKFHNICSYRPHLRRPSGLIWISITSAPSEPPDADAFWLQKGNPHRTHAVIKTLGSSHVKVSDDAGRGREDSPCFVRLKVIFHSQGGQAIGWKSWDKNSEFRRTEKPVCLEASIRHSSDTRIYESSILLNTGSAFECILCVIYICLNLV